MLETPILIDNYTHIELTKIVKRAGVYYNPKIYFFIGDIFSIEGSRYGTDHKKCTKIVLQDGTILRVTESYKSVRETHKLWTNYIQSIQSQQQ